MLNNVALVGRLTKDVELKQTQNGKSVASFTLAVNRNFKNAQGETEADFINCVIWGKSAEALAQYTQKGTMIGADGSIQTRTYDDKDGKRVYVTEVNVNNFHFLEKRQDNQQSGYGQQGGYQQNAYQQPIPEAQQVDFGDKLPF